VYARQRISSVTDRDQVISATTVPSLSAVSANTLTAIIPSAGWPEPRPLAWRLLARLDWTTHFSRFFGTRRDAVLLFHSVGGVPGTNYQWDLPVMQFQAILRCLDDRFKIVDLSTLTDDPPSNRKRVAITFDDAFRNVYTNAIPLLRELNLPATVFVNSSFVNGDHSRRLRERLGLGSGAQEIVMTVEQLRDLADDPLFTLGNHTANHVDLTEADRGTLRKEILGGKQAIKDRFGVSADRFAYPYGAVDKRAAEIISEGHTLAVTSVPALLSEPVNPMKIPRLDACQPAPVACFEMSDLSARLRRLVRTANL